MRKTRLTGYTFAAAAILFAAAAPQSVRAQEIDQQKIIACMMENTTDENRKMFSDMIIAALQYNDAEVRKGVVLLGSLITELALNKCHMSFRYLQQPEFKQIAHDYGQKVGEDIMNQAFARLK